MDFLFGYLLTQLKLQQNPIARCLILSCSHALSLTFSRYLISDLLQKSLDQHFRIIFDQSQSPQYRRGYLNACYTIILSRSRITRKFAQNNLVLDKIVQRAAPLLIYFMTCILCEKFTTVFDLIHWTCQRPSTLFNIRKSSKQSPDVYLFLTNMSWTF